MKLPQQKRPSPSIQQNKAGPSPRVKPPLQHISNDVFHSYRTREKDRGAFYAVATVVVFIVILVIAVIVLETICVAILQKLGFDCTPSSAEDCGERCCGPDGEGERGVA